MRLVLSALAVLGMVWIAACGGASGLHESCTKEGQTGECVSGDVCAKQTNGAIECLKICTQQSDCASDEACNGTSGSLKACRAK
jgi:hypothetical protein